MMHHFVHLDKALVHLVLAHLLVKKMGLHLCQLHLSSVRLSLVLKFCLDERRLECLHSEASRLTDTSDSSIELLRLKL